MVAAVVTCIGELKQGFQYWLLVEDKNSVEFYPSPQFGNLWSRARAQMLMCVCENQP